MLAVSDVQSLREENARLKRIIDEKDEEITFLRDAFRPVEWEPPVEIGLTSQEARIIACLYKNGKEVCSKERVFMSVYHDVIDQPDMKIIDVFVCKARKKLTDFGIEIKTAWGRGYYLDQASIDILKNWGFDPNDEQTKVL